MAVQVPRLRNTANIGRTATGGRIRVRAQDSSQSILGRTKAISQLVETGANVYETYENRKITQLSQEADREYSNWHDQELQKLTKVTGTDPTEAYADFEKRSDEKYQEILNKRPDLSGRVKKGLESNLGRIRNNAKVQMMKQRGLQTETYKNNLYKSTLNLTRDKLATNVSNVRKGEQGIYDQHLHDLKTTIAKRSLENGAAKLLPPDAKSWGHKYINESGQEVKISWEQLGRDEVNREFDESIFNSIKSAIDGGEKDQAKVAFEKYKQFLSPKSISKINKQLEEESVKEDAFEIVSKIEAKPKDEQTTAIKNIKDPEVKSEVIKIVEANDRRLTNLRKRREDRNFEETQKVLDQMERSGQLNGMADVEANPQIRGMWDNLSHKQKKAIEERVKSPKNSKEESLIRVHNLFLGNDPQFKSVRDVTPAKFQEYLVGLNAADRNKMTTRYLNRTSAQDTNQQDVRYNKLAKRLRSKLIAQELIKIDDFGKIGKRDTIKLNKAYDDLQDAMEELPPNASVRETSEWLDNYIAQKKREELFGSGNPWSDTKSPTGERGIFDTISDFFSGDDEPAEVIRKTTTDRTTKEKSNPLTGLQRIEIVKFQRQYKQKFNTGIPKVTDEVFLEYVRGQLKAGQR